MESGPGKQSRSHSMGNLVPGGFGSLESHVRLIWLTVGRICVHSALCTQLVHSFYHKVACLAKTAGLKLLWWAPVLNFWGKVAQRQRVGSWLLAATIGEICGWLTLLELDKPEPTGADHRSKRGGPGVDFRTGGFSHAIKIHSPRLPLLWGATESLKRNF